MQSDSPTGDVVVLLGAGASRDAGLPLVAELTPLLYEAIISDVGPRGADVQEFIEIVRRTRPEIAWNYEVFFTTALEVYTLASYRLRGNIGIPDQLQDVPYLLPGRAAKCLADVLGGWSRGDASYLRHLDSLAPNRPTKVFSLNYDTLVEEACSSAGIPVATGFDETGTWRPELFDQAQEGVALHKVHGSLSWFECPWESPTHVTEARDMQPDPSLAATKKPAIVLGPVKTRDRIETQWDKIQDFLLRKCCDEIATASGCVVIGFSWSDEHVVGEIVRANDRGMHVVEVGPTETGRSHLGPGDRYLHLPSGARDALENGLVVEAVRSLV